MVFVRNHKYSIAKTVFTCLGVFLSAFTITVIIRSVFMKIALENTLRQEAEEYEAEESTNPNTYDDYFEAKYKATFEFVDNIIYIKKRIDEINKEQRIYNIKRYGPVKQTTFILVIQVHENLAFLKLLLSSLKKVVGITNALLIFCHDYYDDSINEIIQKVSFAKYMQVFYPYSSQLYPKMFPGSDTKFCSGDFNCTEFCTDVFECLRTANLVQQKHFWWWHVNFVFNHLKIIRNYEDPIVFLEENQYVLQDFLFIWKALVSLMPASCPQCEIISFGAHSPKTSQYNASNGNVVIQYWNPGLLDKGLAFNRTVWMSVLSDSSQFCHFDDYRWNASLIYLASQRPQGPMVMLSSIAPRVLGMELCDGSIPECTLLSSIEDVIRFSKLVRKGLYPRNLIFHSDDSEPIEFMPGGEWKDVRDHALCMYFAKN